MLLHSYQLSRFKSFPKYEKKAKVLKVFSAAEIFFIKTYAGVTQSPNSNIYFSQAARRKKPTPSGNNFILALYCCYRPSKCISGCWQPSYYL